MKKLISAAVIVIAGLMGTGTAMAQWQNSARFDRDLRACSRAHPNFERCMWDRGWQRGHGKRWVPRRPGPLWQQPVPPPWHHRPPPPRNPPRLSDMQQRALANCNLLPPRDRPRCRATVMSTVR